MMIRAVLSWFPVEDSSTLVQFVMITTEPIVIPVRQLLEKIKFTANLPIDLSFFVAYLLLIFVRVLLPAVHF
jgi:YggT family protein